MKLHSELTGFRELSVDEIELIAGGAKEAAESSETIGQEIVVTGVRMSNEVSASGGGGGMYPESFYGLQDRFGGAYSVTFWEVDSFVTEYFDDNGFLIKLESNYQTDLPNPPVNDPSLYASVGGSVGYGTYGAAVSQYGVYVSTGYGNPGVSGALGYTNSASGYLTGDGVSGNTPIGIGGGVSQDGSAWAVSLGTPGVNFSRGYTFSDAVIGMGERVHRFIMEN